MIIMREKEHTIPGDAKPPFESTKALAGDFTRGVPYLFLAVGPFGRALPPLQFGSHLASRFTGPADESTDRDNEHVDLANNGQDFCHLGTRAALLFRA
jgi:hypothetical protein